MGRLTESQLRAWLRAGQPLSGKSDGDGLTFTLSRAGCATWVLQYRIAGKQRELTLGNEPDMSLADARKRAGKARVKISDGIDVAAEKRKSKQEAAGAGTFRELGEDYMARVAHGLAPITRSEMRRYLDDDIYPRIGNLTAARRLSTSRRSKKRPSVRRVEPPAPSARADVPCRRPGGARRPD